MRRMFLCGLVCFFSLGIEPSKSCYAKQFFEEIRRFDAEEAHQGVAVDDEYFYAINNKVIGKYEKSTGKFVARWQATKQQPLIHLNSGVVFEDKLYCAHSNSPCIPMTSSVEIWETETMKHVSTHSFGIYEGSLTWIDRHDGSWWAVFAHYSKRSLRGNDGKDGRWTTLIQFNDLWQRQQAWVFPKKVLKRFAPHSSSGGGWGPGDLIYCTGHDRKEFYALRIPKAGSILELVGTVPANVPGQAFAWDRSEQNIVWGVNRNRQEVVVSRLIELAD